MAPRSITLIGVQRIDFAVEVVFIVAVADDVDIVVVVVYC